MTIFPDFTLENSPLLTDFAVGYRTNVAGGERQYTLGTILTLFKANTTPADIGAATAAQGALADTALQPAAIGTTVQAFSSKLTAFAALGNDAGWLHNDGSGVYAWTTPTKGDIGLGNVENVALSTWAGSGNLTTLGTITSGTWHGTAIATGFGGMKTGGSTGQVLAKASNADFDLVWTTPLAGTVTSVALTMPDIFTVGGSPITSSGTFTVALESQAANRIFAGPTSGGTAAPTFRALVAADIPDLSGTYQPLDADLTAIAALAGTGIAVRTGGSTWSLRTITGTAARISVTNGDGVSGNPAIDIASTYVGQNTITTLGTITTGTWAGSPIAADHGGTGQIIYTTGDILVATTATTLAQLNAVAVGQVLVSAGVATAPTWSANPRIGSIGVGVAAASGGPILRVTNNTGGLPTAYSTTQVLVHVGNTDSASPAILIDGSGGGGLLELRRAQGTVASPTQLTTGTIIGTIGWRGYGSTVGFTNRRAEISAVALEDWTNTANGSKIVFNVTAATTVTTAEAMSLTAALLTIVPAVSVSSTTEATSPTAASVVLAGGLGVSKFIWGKTGLVLGATGSDGAITYNRTSDGAAVATLNYLNASTELRMNNAVGKLSFYSSNVLALTLNTTATFSVANSDTAILLSGTTKGVRIGTNTTGGKIEGVDSTGSGSYQPLAIGGSQVIFTNAGTTIGTFDNVALTITQTAATSQLLINASAGQFRGLGFQSSSVNRWYIAAINNAESGSNVGSDLGFYAYSDAGSPTLVLQIIRATGTIVAGVGGSGGGPATMIMNSGSASATGPYIDFRRNNSSKAGIGLESVFLGNNNDNLFVYGTGNAIKFYFDTVSTVMTISPTNNGSVLIGNTTSSSTANPAYLSLGGTYSSTTGANLKLRLYDSGGAIFGLGISSGTLFYTVDTGSTHLWTVNTTSLMSMNGSTGGLRLFLYGAGTLVTDASGNVSASSDGELKTVRGAFVRGLDAIRELRPVLYMWNEKSGMDMRHLNAGFIAQDVEQVIPEAVGVGARGYRTLADRPIIAATVNAIKELEQTVLAQAKQIRALEEKLASLGRAA